MIRIDTENGVIQAKEKGFPWNRRVEVLTYPEGKVLAEGKDAVIDNNRVCLYEANDPTLKWSAMRPNPVF